MNMQRRRHQVVFSDEGGVELLCNGKTVWASDADPDFNQEFGDDALADAELAQDDADLDALEEELIDGVLDYLVEKHHLTESQAEMCDVVMPELEDQPE